MSGPLINALLEATKAACQAAGLTVTPGQPYRREAPLTPFEHNAMVCLARPAPARDLVYLLGMPSTVLDALGGLSRPTPVTRTRALAELAGRVVAGALEQVEEPVEPSTPHMVHGWDVVVPWLPGERLCMPWTSGVGGFVTEAGHGQSGRHVG